MPVEFRELLTTFETGNRQTCQSGGCAVTVVCKWSVRGEPGPGLPRAGRQHSEATHSKHSGAPQEKIRLWLGGIFGSARTTQVHSASRRGGYAKIRSTLSRHDDVEGTVSFRRRCRRHCRIAVRAHLVRLLLLERVSDLLLPMLDLCMQARARARRSACSRTSRRRQSSRLHGLEPHIIALW